MPDIEKYIEWRGVRGLCAAEIIEDSAESFVTGAPFAIAGTAQLEKTTDTSNDTHYYDNIGAIVVTAVGNDTVTIQASALPMSVYAKITGQKYDAAKGAVYEGKRDNKYFALGYITSDTDGADVYVWRLKGKFAVGAETHNTIANNTDANGQELTYTGITTTHKFTAADGNGATAVVVETALGKADVTQFFDAVTTPDTLTALVPATGKLFLDAATGTTITVTKDGVELADYASLTQGDELIITSANGTLFVNGAPFTSGDLYTVATGNVQVSTLVS